MFHHVSETCLARQHVSNTCLARTNVQHVPSKCAVVLRVPRATWDLTLSPSPSLSRSRSLYLYPSLARAFSLADRNSGVEQCRPW